MFDELDYIGGGAIAILFFLALIALVIGIIYLLALQRALQSISLENRKMPPGQVWLLLIPIFNLVWLFFVVTRIADSFRDEFEKLNISYKEQRPSYGIGLPYAVLNVCSILPFLGSLAGIGAFICWIVYWVKVVECRKLVEANQGNDLLEAERGIFYDSPNTDNHPTNQPSE